VIEKDGGFNLFLLVSTTESPFPVKIMFLTYNVKQADSNMRVRVLKLLFLDKEDKPIFFFRFIF
jgi:hypothetical protein